MLEFDVNFLPGVKVVMMFAGTTTVNPLTTLETRDTLVARAGLAVTCLSAKV